MKFSILLMTAVLAYAPLMAQTPPTVTLICKNIQTHPESAGNININDFRAIDTHLTKVQLTTATGTTIVAYVSTETKVTKKFLGVTIPAGARGENLTPGQCGLATAVIKGIDTRLNSASPIIVFNDVDDYTMRVGVVNGVAKNTVIAALPRCPSAIYSIVATQFSPNEYYVRSASNVTCVP